MNESQPAPETRESLLESFRICREEVMHEQSVLGNRVNSYITSQSFLISAYAVSMGNLNPHWGAGFRLAFPLILSFVGFLLSVRAQPGIYDATEVIRRWHERQDGLLQDHPELHEYVILRKQAMAKIRSRDQLFALSAAYIFGGAWIAMAAISTVLYFVG